MSTHPLERLQLATIFVIYLLLINNKIKKSIIAALSAATITSQSWRAVFSRHFRGGGGGGAGSSDIWTVSNIFFPLEILKIDLAEAENRSTPQGKNQLAELSLSQDYYKEYVIGRDDTYLF